MSIILPGKKVQALLIIVLALFASYFLYTLNVKGRILSALTGEEFTSSLNPVEKTDTINSDLDTDNDGLKDWQEVLWKTDKNNSDTDGDSTSDGDEVVGGRDPMIPGPNDTLPETRGVSDADASALSKSINDNPDNLSTTISRSLFAHFMSLQSSGQLTEGSEEEIVNKVLSEVDPDVIPPKYTIADLKLVETDTISMKTYGNGLAKAANDYNQVAGGYSNDQFALTTYDSMIKTTADLPVPGSLGILHLQILNNMNSASVALNDVINYQKDPVKALLSMKLLQSIKDQSDVLFGNLAAEFKKNGIIFNQGEPGIVWNTY